jgi:pyruvate/2-oxoglutarate dehydrogenase complex dihydrolipoamide dehydrogenase (E3) component
MRSALIAVVSLLVLAPTAGAASIAYIDGGEVWLSSLDGKQKVRLAAPVVNSEGKTEKWLDVAASDSGRIVAARNVPARMSNFSWFKVWEPKQIFLDVGGRAVVSGIEGLTGVRYFDNSSMMELDHLPEHLLIVGGSYVGLEFAQMYRRFGSRVTVIEHGPRLIAREDDDVSAEVRRILELEGIEVHEASACPRAGRDSACGTAAPACTATLCPAWSAPARRAG